MKKGFMLLVTCISITNILSAQNKPCNSDPVYRQFDFWIGEWEAYNTKGIKAGDSKISLILDSCVVLEEWVSATVMNGLRYAGKSFNSYNSTTKQWQQTWFDNTGSNTLYTKGKFNDNKLIFETNPWQYSKDTVAVNRLTFFNIDKNKVRQLGEISKDNGKSWVVQYDLEYRRKTTN